MDADTGAPAAGYACKPFQGPARAHEFYQQGERGCDAVATVRAAMDCIVGGGDAGSPGHRRVDENHILQVGRLSKGRLELKPSRRPCAHVICYIGRVT